MGRRPTKAADNPFCRARLGAAKHNERLYSKEGAAELLGVSVSTLSDYELGLTKVIPPDMVVKMSELYNAPELENYYCTELCPLGCGMQKISVEGLDRISIRAFDALRGLDGTEGLLLGIVRDGVVTEDERPDMQRVLESLGKLEAVTQSLKLWAKKNL